MKKTERSRAKVPYSHFRALSITFGRSEFREDAEAGEPEVVREQLFHDEGNVKGGDPGRQDGGSA